MHRNADLDALCSAYALKSIFPNSVIVTPDELGRPARNFASFLNVEILEFRKVKKEQFDGLIIVDCATYVMMSEAKDWPVICLIDHHQKSDSEERIIAEFEFSDSASPSTCQIISNLIEPSAPVAFALGIGIISDTARFKSGNLGTFSSLASMISISGKPYSEMLFWAEPELEADEKVRILSAFHHSQVVTYGNYVIATVLINSSESDASASLSEFADVAFAASWRNAEKETRVSARARKHVPIALNEIMSDIGARFAGNGGGHKKAAGANAHEKPEIVLEECVNAVKDAIDKVKT